MNTVLVAYASRMGSTQEIAEAIGAQLVKRGFPVEVTAAEKAPSAHLFDAVVLGSALYIGRWDKAALSYLKQNGSDLRGRPTWLFQSGPAGPGEEYPNPRTPGAVRRQCRSWGLAAPTTFGGNLDPARARGRLARWMANGDLAGDFRDWDQIRMWVDTIADQLMSRQTSAST